MRSASDNNSNEVKVTTVAEERFLSGRVVGTNLVRFLRKAVFDSSFCELSKA